ncbi:MAG: hypothetical protein JWN03_108 [Nocardia sp.]|uniref:DUF6585 family protein n=1 Tax=Nocardia sp. TaxID=1821 RepID=UPI002605DFF7|nr:DUF6585 family protein [Nocardia sp.]MCU1639833.1 hypothetical protein [Nocardia sp.]
MPESIEHDDLEMPDGVEKSAAEAHLGKPVATYPWRMPPIPWRGYLAWGAVVLVLCGAWGYLAGAAAGVGWAALWILVLAIPPVLRRRSRFIDKNAHLALYEHGLVAVGADGMIRIARYDSTLAYLYAGQYQADAFRRKDGRPKEYTGGLTDIAGQRFPLNGYFETDFWQRGGYTDPQQWAPTIHDRIVAARFEAAAAALDAGETLDFGPIHISATDISASGAAVAWPAVEEISVDDGRVGITVGGVRQTLKGAELVLIPNYRLFDALTNRCRRPKPVEPETDRAGGPETD